MRSAADLAAQSAAKKAGVNVDIEQKLTHQAFLNREASISHLDYERENAFFKCMQDGDTEGVQRLYEPLGTSEMGTLSDNPLRNLQYHLIITEGTKTEPQYFDAIRQVIAFAVPLTEILTLKHGK